jgi:hypothetical protein
MTIQIPAELTFLVLFLLQVGLGLLLVFYALPAMFRLTRLAVQVTAVPVCVALWLSINSVLLCLRLAFGWPQRLLRVPSMTDLREIFG